MRRVSSTIISGGRPPFFTPRMAVLAGICLCMCARGARPTASSLKLETKGKHWIQVLFRVERIVQRKGIGYYSTDKSGEVWERYWSICISHSGYIYIRLILKCSELSIFVRLQNHTEQLSSTTFSYYIFWISVQLISKGPRSVPIGTHCGLCYGANDTKK